MATPHIEAEKQEIASVVLMPGDPLRAEFIAKTYLTDVVPFNKVRNMLGFTGWYQGKRISVMGSGMGMPSIGIYSYELFKFYDVNAIIRVGSCGAYTDALNLYDVLLASSAWSESSYACTQSQDHTDEYTYPSKELNQALVEAAHSLNIPLTQGVIHSSDVFYRERFEEYQTIFQDKGAIAVEMESFALFHNATLLNKHAACVLTVSDSLVTHEATQAQERQVAFTKMMEVALQAAVHYAT
jgi:purine-nucleoside phosphorylase